jgi:hypothetical protein
MGSRWISAFVVVNTLPTERIASSPAIVVLAALLSPLVVLLTTFTMSSSAIKSRPRQRIHIDDIDRFEEPPSNLQLEVYNDFSNLLRHPRKSIPTEKEDDAKVISYAHKKLRKLILNDTIPEIVCPSQNTIPVYRLLSY